MTTDEERELRKKIVEGDPVEGGTIFSRGLQFFLVPLLIVGCCVLLYAFFSYLAGSGARSAKDIVADLREGGAKARAQAALELAELLRSAKPEDLRREGPVLAADLMAAYASLPNDGPVHPTVEVGAPLHIKILIVQCLALLREPSSVDFLLAEAQRGPEGVRPHAIDALGGAGDTGVVPALIQMLDSPSTVTRKYAAHSLGMLRDPRAVEPLKGRLGDDRLEVRWNAACSLAFYFRDASGADILRQMLDRSHLAGAVGVDPEAPQLIAQSQRVALNAVAALGDPSFADAVRRLAEGDPDAAVRHTAHQALAYLEKR